MMSEFIHYTEQPCETSYCIWHMPEEQLREFTHLLLLDISDRRKGLSPEYLYARYKAVEIVMNEPLMGFPKRQGEVTA